MTQSRIGLSFDDGPSCWTPLILDLLTANDARATFFLVGSLVEQHPDLVRRLSAEGHEVGNHTWSHPALARDCDDDRVHEELARTNDVLERVLGTPPTLFRAPHYNFDARVNNIAATLGLRHSRGDVAPPDWHPGLSPAVIATLVLQRITPGAVVGLHDGVPPGEIAEVATRRPTVDAVATILPVLARRGITCLTVSEVTTP